MRDKPCQKGNQPCCCNASLLNLSFAFFTRYAGPGYYANTNTCIFSCGAHSVHQSGCGLCDPSLFHYKANKSIPSLYL